MSFFLPSFHIRFSGFRMISFFFNRIEFLFFSNNYLVVERKLCEHVKQPSPINPGSRCSSVVEKC